jgi:hypothetical protein
MAIRPSEHKLENSRNGRGLIMRRAYGTATLATKAVYFLMAAVVLVFVAMLVLTVLHP